MRYYVKSKFFNIKEDFWVKDERDENCYFIDKEFFSFGLQFKVIKNNIELYTVKEKLLRFMPSYEIYDRDDNLIAAVKKQVTFFKDRINVESNYGDFQITGNFWHYNYSISYNEKTVAVIDKEFLSFTDNYYVDINYDNHPFILALVFIIDNIIDKRNNN